MAAPVPAILCLSLLLAAGAAGLVPDAAAEPTGIHVDPRNDPSPEENRMRQAHDAMSAAPEWAATALGDLWRHTSTDEQASNGWESPTQLLAFASPRQILAAPDQFTFSVPLDVDHTVTATKASTEIGAPITVNYLQLENGPKAKATESRIPTYTVYTLTVDGQDIPGRAIVEEGYGWTATGVIEATKFHLDPEAAWWDLHLPSPGNAGLALLTLRPAPAPTQALAIEANIGSIFDLAHPDGPYIYNFANIGETKWCTRYSTSWSTKIYDMQIELQNAFKDDHGNAGTEVEVHKKHDNCWISGTLSAATTCANSGGCTDGSGHQYPFNGNRNYYTEYLKDAWPAVSHSRLHYTYAQLKLIQIVHDGSLTSSSDGACGAASDTTVSSVNYPGASVTAGESLPSGCLDYVWTHEMGHNFNGQHNNEYNGDCVTALGQSVSGASCRLNYFNAYSQLEIYRCSHAYDSKDSCPRYGTA